ncbi:MAG: hypothetical protein ACLTSZ_04350 [Lachnospiraceae bacterium]
MDLVLLGSVGLFGIALGLHPVETTAAAETDEAQVAEEPQQWELAGVQLPDGVSNMLNTVKAFTVEGNPYDRGIFYKEHRCDDGNKVKSYDCIPAVCICDTDFIQD